MSSGAPRPPPRSRCCRRSGPIGVVGIAKGRAWCRCSRARLLVIVSAAAMGDLIRISPSQIKTFRLCPARWAARSCLRLPETATPWAERGRRLHAAIEGYMLAREMPALEAENERAAFRSFVEHLPRDRLLQLEGLAEVPAELPSRAGGVPYILNGVVDRLAVTDRQVVVVDFKTVSSFNSILTEETLQDDVQALAYGHIASACYRGRAVVLHWVYIHSRGERAVQTVTAILAPGEATTRWHRLEQRWVAPMLTMRARDFTELRALPHNPRACTAFLGCDHWESCGRSRDETIAAAFWRGTREEQLMKLDELFKKQEREQPTFDELVEAAQGAAQGLNPEATTLKPQLESSLEEKESPKEKRGKSKKTARGKLRILAVGCAPTKGEGDEVVTFSNYVQPVLQRIKDDHGLDHYTLAEYGKGRGLLCAYLRQHVGESPWTGVLLLPDTAMGRDVLEVLDEAAHVTFQSLG